MTIQPDLLTQLLSQVSNVATSVLNFASCGPVASSFLAAKNGVCVGALHILDGLWLFFFWSGICLVFGIWLWTRAKRRFAMRSDDFDEMDYEPQAYRKKDRVGHSAFDEGEEARYRSILRTSNLEQEIKVTNGPYDDREESRYRDILQIHAQSQVQTSNGKTLDKETLDKLIAEEMQYNAVQNEEMDGEEDELLRSISMFKERTSSTTTLPNEVSARQARGRRRSTVLAPLGRRGSNYVPPNMPRLDQDMEADNLSPSAPFGSRISFVPSRVSHHFLNSLTRLRKQSSKSST